MEEEEPREPKVDLPLRSLNSLHRCLLYIRNNSRRHVNVRWLNYEGEEQQYFELEPNGLKQVNTFTTHPWIFRDSSRNTIVPVSAHKGMRTSRQSTELMGTNLRVFHPPLLASDQEVAAVVIWDKVYSLRDVCFQKFIDLNITYEELAKHVPKHVISDFELFRTGLPLSRAVQSPEQDHQPNADQMYL
ncbi:hypothetical protein TYRP_008434 [Tyrophagus putrescentiae]|nr:hypothetical protein TYRP_008434 [Tyrophagus putrescentiae]